MQEFTCHLLASPNPHFLRKPENTFARHVPHTRQSRIRQFRVLLTLAHPRIPLPGTYLIQDSHEFGDSVSCLPSPTREYPCQHVPHTRQSRIRPVSCLPSPPENTLARHVPHTRQSRIRRFRVLFTLFELRAGP